MKKRILSLFLAFVMAVGLLPMSVFATGGTEDTDTVYISISYNGRYVNAANGDPTAYIPVSLDDLQTIDLEDYGLTEYNYDGQLTALHLYIYTHETIMGESWNDVNVQGEAGSIFFASGLFGFEDCNLQYYCNGEYPADEDGWGVTADQLVLNDGDFVDIAAYTSWSFYSDSAFGFHYFLADEEITHEYTATAGEPLTVTLGRGASSMGVPGSTITKVGGYTVSYGTAFGTATGTVTTNSNGDAEIAFSEAGIYYLWADGGYGAEHPQEIVSSPAYAKVTVTAPACEHTWKDATCTDPKTCANCGETEGEADPDAHNYVDGTCKYCGGADAERTYTVTLPSGEGYTVSATENSTSPVAEGGSYSFTVTIAEGYEAGESFAVKANDVTLTATDGVYTIESITVDQIVTVKNVVEKTSEACPVTVIAPIGSTVSVGTLKNYFIYTFAEPIKVTETATTGTVTYGFDVPSFGGNVFVRVQHPDGVTYWDYMKMENGTVINITEDMLFINDNKHNADTIIHDLSEYEMDVADVYINANAQGYMPMNVGDTHEFNVFRDWHAVEGISNAKTALPDVSYQVIDIEGHASDVVTVVPDKNNSSVATMTANKEGTAIVLVTYDAMYSTLALRGGIGTETAKPAFFSAIWPENTGVLVVTVGDAGSFVETNMTLNGHALDAEHDVLYYIGDEGAAYTFKPENGSKVEVARANLTDDSLTYDGFESVDPNADGSFTVSGLTAGSHIVKVINGESVTYQVICAKETTVTVTDAAGEVIDKNNPADPGEKVTVQLGSIYNPVNKLSGIYNSNCALVFNGENGRTFNGERGSGFGYYLFAADPSVHKVIVTVPEIWAQDTYTLTYGYFSIAGNGKSAGSHRFLRYATGAEMDSSAPATAGLLGSLPRINIPVNASERVAATNIELNKTSLALNIEGAEQLVATITPEVSTDVVTWSSSAPAIATVDKNGLVTGIAAGEAVITATAGEVSATCSVTVSSQQAVNLVLTTQNAYDEEVFLPTMEFSEITLSGLAPTGEMKGIEVKDGKNVIVDSNKECTIYIKSGNYDSITVSLKPLLGSVAQGSASKLTYVIGDTVSNALSSYTDFTYTTSIAPVWNNGQAVVNLKLLFNNSKERDSYTINLVVSDEEPEPTTYTVTLPESPVGYTITPAEDSTSSVTEGGSYSFTVAIADGYKTSETFAVKANDTKLTSVEGVYTIENITADQTITVEGVVEKQEEPARTWQEVMAMTQTYLTEQAKNTAPIVGTNKGEWMVLGLARNDVSPDADIFGGYYDNVVNFVKEKIDAETGRLDKNQATVNARVILGLTSIGKDVTDVAGHNLLKGLSDTDFVKKQGINGPVWALIALDSHNYEIPTNADSSKQVTREWLIDYILDPDNQLEGGGWTISGNAPDDMTPMAVQALAPYYNTNPAVKTAVDKALAIMDGMVETTTSPETLSQIIVARSALGLDSEAAVAKLAALVQEDGSFKKGPSDNKANQMSTEQAFYAMVAYDRFQSRETSLYNMSDVTIEESTHDTPDNPGTPSQPNPPAETPEFGLDEDEIVGYVTVSFEDFGKRVAGEEMETIYSKSLGTIIPATQVPYATGDTIATVTLRLLEAMEFTASYEGSDTSGFYLEAIGGFTHKGTYYDSFGEFDAGIGSGWMITWNNWFINKGASDFAVKNGDKIRWQYTCQLGADIGDDGSAVGGGNQAPQVPPEVLPEEPPVTSSPYTDVTGHWAEKAISVVHEKGLMTGTREDTFSPETELSRAMLVTILYRMAGEPAVTADNTFSDVTDGTWYTNAVIWASQNGIVNGVGQDRFAPDQDITREQMAAMLLRYSDYKGYDTTQKNDLADYTDADQISTWALAALQWANGEGLITGRKADLLVPQGDTTRAETATILMRYLETIA